MKRPSEVVALCLGSNSPDSEHQLLTALEALAALLDVDRVASPWRTRAVSPIEQPDYLNTALLARSPYEPDTLLGLAKALEHSAGRRRGPRFGPRVLDVDLVLQGGRVESRPALTLPHPRLHERAFFLAPLAEIAPELRVPPTGHTVADLLATVDRSGVERLAWSRSPVARQAPIP